MSTVSVPVGLAVGWLESRPDGALRRIVFWSVVVFVLGLNTHGNFAGSGDEPHYAMIAHSIVFDGDLDLANDYADRSNLVGTGSLEPGAHAIPGRDGRLRPVHDIGLPILFAPVFAAAYQMAERSTQWIPPRLMARARLTRPLVLRHVLSAVMALVTGAMALLLFGVCRSLGGSRPLALGWTLICVCSPPILSHAFLFFTEIPAALIVSAYCADLQAAAPRTSSRSALLGLGVGFLLLLHVRNVGLAIGMVGLFAWRWRNDPARLRHVGAFLVPVIAFAVVRTIVNYAFWGTLITNPHAAPVAVGGVWTAAGETVTRLAGLLVDQEHGLLAYAPIYLLALPGILLLAKTNRRASFEFGVLLASYTVPILLPMINRHGWSGGWSPAARFLVPVTPLFVLYGVRFMAGLSRMPWAVFALLLAQVLLDAVYWSHPKVLWNEGTGASALARFLSPSWLDMSAWLPSWHHPSVYTTALSASLLAVWAVVSVRATRRLNIAPAIPVP
jgi:hypothetical protein